MDQKIVPGIVAPQDVIGFPASATVNDAVRMMADRHIGAIIVTENDEMTGIFTERDALTRVLANGMDPTTTKLSEVMTADPDTLGPNDRAGDALSLMREKRYRHLPIVEDGHVVAMLSARDLHEAFLAHMEDEVSFL